MTLPLYLLLPFVILHSLYQISQARITYGDHCSSVVPQSLISTTPLPKDIKLHFSNAYSIGGDNLFSSSSSSSSSSSPSSSSKNKYKGRVSFYLYEIYSTKDPDVYHLTSQLYIQGQSTHSNWMPKAYDPKDLRRSTTSSGWSSISVSFDLSGFWSKSTGKLCMVGSGTSRSFHGKNNPNHNVLYTVNIDNNSSIFKGSIKSLDSYFKTISVVGYHKSKDYTYTKIPAVRAMCASLKADFPESIGFENHNMSNYIWFLTTTFHLEYGKDHIIPLFPSSDTKFMSLSSVESGKNGEVTMVISFTNSSDYAYDYSLVPEKSFVGEGYWDSSRKLLCILACPFLEDLSIGECTVGLSFRFPSMLTVKNRANVLGRIWSSKDKKELGYFDPISVRSLRGGNNGFVPGVKYEYTKLDSVKKRCEEKNGTSSRFGRYPNGNSIADLNFDLSVKTKDNKSMPGYAVPFSLDGEFFGNLFLRITNDVSFLENKNHLNYSSFKIGYLIKYGSSINDTIEISAEGIYNSKIGKICMVGCKSHSDDDAQDCDIQIDIQLSPYDIFTNNNTDIRHLINGTIVSTRKNADPLYLEALTLSSYTIYESEYQSIVERMDMEIIFVMMSLTFLCICTVMQIFYARKHKNAMPSISIIMLVILVTGQVVPLLLNLEAMFVSSRSSRSVMLQSGGWIEVNGVVVRVLTLVAMLLQLRLLQLTMDNSKFREVKVMKFLLPLYFGGVLISWLVQRRTFSAQHVISYCGLIFDGFLLPQVLFNLVVDSKEKALAPVFYMGTTAVRVFPHIYNVYRARYSVTYSNLSYLYASEDTDFFSSIWDFITPLGSTLLAVLVFLQQEYGGACLIPLRFRKRVGYERVPVINL